MRTCLLSLCCISVSGCGTLANLNRQTFPLMGGDVGPPRIYGGLQNDMRWVSEGTLPVYFATVDPVLSLIGDTVTIPRVLYARHSDCASARNRIGGANSQAELNTAETPD